MRRMATYATLAVSQDANVSLFIISQLFSSSLSLFFNTHSHTVYPLPLIPGSVSSFNLSFRPVVMSATEQTQRHQTLSWPKVMLSPVWLSWNTNKHTHPPPTPLLSSLTTKSSQWNQPQIEHGGGIASMTTGRTAGIWFSLWRIKVLHIKDSGSHRELTIIINLVGCMSWVAAGSGDLIFNMLRHFPFNMDVI